MASSLREFLIHKGLLTGELNSAIIEYDNLQLMKLNEKTMPFGKYKGESLEKVLKNKTYCNWLLKETEIFNDNRFVDIKEAIQNIK